MRKAPGRLIREPAARFADFVVLLLTNAWEKNVSDNSHDNYPRLFAESKSTLPPPPLPGLTAKRSSCSICHCEPDSDAA
jgi:hypothetical protein